MTKLLNKALMLIGVLCIIASIAHSTPTETLNSVGNALLRNDVDTALNWFSSTNTLREAIESTGPMQLYAFASGLLALDIKTDCHITTDHATCHVLWLQRTAKGGFSEVLIEITLAKNPNGTWIITSW